MTSIHYLITAWGSLILAYLVILEHPICAGILSAGVVINSFMFGVSLAEEKSK